MSVLSAVYGQVYVKSAWANAWTLVDALEPLIATIECAPRVSTATIRYEYGNIAREDAASFSAETPVNYGDHYVKIVDSGGTAAWYGVILQRAYEVEAAQAADPSGRQILTAYGLEQLLDQVPILGAFTEGDGVAVEIDRGLTFNRRHTHGGTLIGNRNSTVLPNNYVFSRSQNAELWSHRDICQYLLAHYGPSGIVWQLGGLSDDLNHICEVVDVEGMTLFQALNRLIDRRRGYSWCIRTTGSGTVTVHVFSLRKTAVTSGVKTFQANADQVAATLHESDYLDDPILRYERQTVFDEIRVQGALVKSCFTVAPADSTLETGWTAANQELYRLAASGEAGYDDLTYEEQVSANQRVRAQKALERVFQVFRIPTDWDGYAGDGAGGTQTNVNPVVGTNGVLDATQEANSFHQDRPILPRLPLLEGVDYSDPAWPSSVDSDAEPVFRRPLVLIKDLEGKYRNVLAMHDPDLPDARSVQPLSREMALRVKFAPPHLIALNRWDSEGTPAVDDVEPAWDYNDMIATVAIETDERLEVIEQSADYPIAEFKRTKVIVIPDAEVWYVGLNTVVDVADDGTLKRVSTPNTIRDDSPRLRTIARLALEWYGTQRAALHYKAKEIVNAAPVGYLITTAQIGAATTLDVNTPVTKVQWDFTRQSTEIQTGWWDVDWDSLAPGGLHEYPDIEVLAAGLLTTLGMLIQMRNWAPGEGNE